MFTKNKIELKGNGNFIIQSEKEVNVFNLNNSFAFFSFLNEKNAKDSGYVKSLYKLIKKDDDKSDDLVEIIQKFKYFEFLKAHFKYAGWLNEYDLLSIFNSTRKLYFNEFYKKRSHDEKLEKKIQIDHLLVIGSSLSGKTRALIEQLIKIKNKEHDVVIFIPKMLDRKDQLSWPEFPDNNRLKYAFFDDIDQYLEKKGTIELINYLVDNDFKILATCKTGPEFDLFHQMIPLNLRESFGNGIQIKREKLSDFEKNDLIRKLGVNLENTDGYDGNIGSLILPLKQMEKRYRDLKRSSHDVDIIALNLLKASKALYYSSNFIAKSTFNKETLTEYCLMLHVGKYANTKISKNNRYYDVLLKLKREQESKSIESFQKNLDLAFSKLESDEFNLNFISVKDNSIEVEDAYLEKIIRYGVAQIYKDINSFFDDQEQKKRGYFVKPYRYNQLLKKMHVSKVMNAYLEMKKLGIKPNVETFSILAKKNEGNYKECIKWYDTAKNNKTLSISLFISLLRSNNNNKAILDVFNRLVRDKGLIISYSLEGLNAIVHILSSKEYQVDLYSIIENLIQKGVSISESFLFIGIKKSKSFLEAKSYLNISLINNIELSGKFFTSLISKSSSFEEAKEVLELTKQHDIKLSKGIFEQMITKTSSLEEAKEVLELTKQHDVKLSKGIFEQMITKTSSLKKAKEVLEFTKQHDIKLSKGIFEQMITKTSSLEEAKEVLEFTKQHDIKLSKGIFEQMIPRTSSFEEAKKALKLAKQHDIKLSEATFQQMVTKTSSFEEAKKALKLAKQYDIKLSEATFQQMVTKTSSFEEAKTVLELAKQHNLIFFETIFIQVSYRVTSYEQANQIIEFIEIDKKISNYGLKIIVDSLLLRLQNLVEIKDFINENRLLDKYPELNSLQNESLLVKDFYNINTFRVFDKVIINNALQTNFDQNMQDPESAKIIKSLIDSNSRLFFDSIYIKLLKYINKS